MIKVKEGMWIDATELGYRVFDGESVFLMPEELSEEDRVLCNAAWADFVLPHRGLTVTAEEASSPKVTMTDLKHAAHIPTVAGVVEALKGEADIETVVDSRLNTAGSNREDCFNTADAEKLHAYIKDITTAYANVIVETAQKDKISKDTSGAAMKAIYEFGLRVKDLMVLVDPNNDADTFVSEKEPNNV